MAQGEAGGSAMVAVLVGLVLPAASWALLTHRPTQWQLVNAASRGDNEEVLRALARGLPIDGFDTEHEEPYR